MAQFKVKLGFTPSLARSLTTKIHNVGDRVKGKVGSGIAFASHHPFPTMTLRDTCCQAVGGGIPSPPPLLVGYSTPH